MCLTCISSLNEFTCHFLMYLFHFDNMGKLESEKRLVSHMPTKTSTNYTIIHKLYIKDGGRNNHLDMRESVSPRPIAAQSVDVRLPRQSQVVVATAGDVHCETRTCQQATVA